MSAAAATFASRYVELDGRIDVSGDASVYTIWFLGYDHDRDSNGRWVHNFERAMSLMDRVVASLQALATEPDCRFAGIDWMSDEKHGDYPLSIWDSSESLTFADLYALLESTFAE